MEKEQVRNHKFMVVRLYTHSFRKNIWGREIYIKYFPVRAAGKEAE